MFRSIRSKLIVSTVIMAALLGGLIYLTSIRLDELEATLSNLAQLEEFKSHVLIPQKDMNQFLAGIDNTVLLVELGEAEGAQEAYDSTADAEQDISAEFAALEQGGTGELLEMSEQAHADWEEATEFLKVYAEKVGAEGGVGLVRPTTEPTKTVDAHTTFAVNKATTDYASLSIAQLEEIADDDEASPVEKADNGIDGLEDATDEQLAAEKAAGEASLLSTSRTILWGSLAVLAGIFAIGLVVTSSISRPLTELKKGAEHIADGDLDYTFTNVPNDEVGDVIHSVQKMSGSLKDRIRNLEEVAGVVVITGDEIETAAKTIEPRTTAVDMIISKAETLKELVGQMLSNTKN